MADSSKKQRGRPRVMSDEEREEYDRTGHAPSDFKGERAIQNEHYARRAHDVLWPDGEGWPHVYAWLAHGRRESVLAELGRIKDDALLRTVAGEVCERQLPARGSIAYVRRRRLGKAPAHDPEQLQAAILATLDDYCDRHPSVPVSDILKALLAVHQDIVAVVEQRHAEREAGR